MGLEGLVREIRLLVSKALVAGEDSREIEETLFEDVRDVDTEEGWKELYHRDIPGALRDVLRRVGLSCRIYHKKDDVPGYEYVANCRAESGRSVALGFDVDYDPEVGEVSLATASAWGDREWNPDRLVYYHEV